MKTPWFRCIQTPAIGISKALKSNFGLKGQKILRYLKLHYNLFTISKPESCVLVIHNIPALLKMKSLTYTIRLFFPRTSKQVLQAATFGTLHDTPLPESCLAIFSKAVTEKVCKLFQLIFGDHRLHWRLLNSVCNALNKD